MFVFIIPQPYSVSLGYGGGWRSALLHRLVSLTLGMFGAAPRYRSAHRTAPVCFAPVLF